MANTKLLSRRPWIAYIDDERDLDNGVIVTLAEGWCFKDDPSSGVRGFDTMREMMQGTAKQEVYKTS